MVTGKSIIALPTTFCIVDLETTGLDFENDDIIEISAIRFENGTQVSSYETLVKPPLSTFYDIETGSDVEVYVSDFIADLTGITNEMLETAPEIRSVLPGFLDFIGDSIIIGHNIPFDMKFLGQALENHGFGDIKNDYINTIRIARKTFPGNPHYRLSDVAKYCGLSQSSAHRALADCETTANCYLNMRDRILTEKSESEFLAEFNSHKNSSSYSAYIESLSGVSCEGNEDSPIWGKTVVFTGTLERMPRKEALAYVAKLGGIPADSLTKETNYLVIGNGEFVASVKNGKTNKMKKAEAMALKGLDIHVVSESAFFKMVDAFISE